MMKRAMMLSATGLMAALPAVAHEAGTHMHPHGSESWVALIPAAILVALAVRLAWWRR